MRSIFRNEKYFIEYINELQSILVQNETKVLDDEIKNKRMKVRNALYKEYILISSYSLGLSLEEIKPIYSDVVKAICENWDSDIVKFKMGQKTLDQLYVYHHDSILRVISIGVLLDEFEELMKLKYLLEKLRINNRLFDKLLKYKIKDHTITIDEDSYCPTAFNKIEKLAFKEQIGIKDLDNYQKTWYSTLNKNYFQWKDTHLNKGNVFCGYWSFSVAALAKINSLSSEKLKENIFFPTDMFTKSTLNYKYQISNEVKLILRLDELISKLGGIRRSTNEILALRKDILKMKKPKFENIETKVNSYIEWIKGKHNQGVSLAELIPYFDRIETEMKELNNSR